METLEYSGPVERNSIDEANPGSMPVSFSWDRYASIRLVEYGAAHTFSEPETEWYRPEQISIEELFLVNA